MLTPHDFALLNSFSVPDFRIALDKLKRQFRIGPVLLN
jgi:hypothetical protein